jgi:hypothetical protein
MPSALRVFAMRTRPTPSAVILKMRRTMAACSSFTTNFAEAFTPGRRWLS